jgi:ABC-2 type transport system ATP-binding protein
VIPIVKTENLNKEFRTPFRLKKIQALEALSLVIEPGEIIGYLGPNGAGKTTTFKLLLGLIRPSRGKIYLWGEDHDQTELKSRIGFLPESPYFYAYLKATEYLHFCGQLFGLPLRTRRERVESLLTRVGLSNHKNALIKNYSKGMLQRLGLAQALINDPELLILDEPMSGLDPLGRKQVRDLILELRDKGKTILFSTHILSDVETVCDRVAILIDGKLRDYGPLEKLLNPKIKSFEISMRGLPESTVQHLDTQGLQLIQRGEETFINVEDTKAYELLPVLLKTGAELVSFAPRKETLEDLYVSETKHNQRHLGQ